MGGARAWPPATRLSVRAFFQLSVLAALATIGLKTAAWWVTGSVGLLSDAMESVVNLVAAVFALAMVTIAQAPADEDHPYGHSKAEYFSSGFEAMMILGAASAIIWAAVHRWTALQPLEGVGLGVVLSIASSVVNGVLAQAMLRAAAQHDSIALEADARHLMTDVWTSVGVAAACCWCRRPAAVARPAARHRGGAQHPARSGSLLRRSVDGLMDRRARRRLSGAHRCGAVSRLAGTTCAFDPPAHAPRRGSQVLPSSHACAGRLGRSRARAAKPRKPRRLLMEACARPARDH
jgi:cation diffusion facilitator family transporter